MHIFRTSLIAFLMCVLHSAVNGQHHVDLRTRRFRAIDAVGQTLSRNNIRARHATTGGLESQPHAARAIFSRRDPSEIALFRRAVLSRDQLKAKAKELDALAGEYRQIRGIMQRLITHKPSDQDNHLISQAKKFQKERQTLKKPDARQMKEENEPLIKELRGAGRKEAAEKLQKALDAAVAADEGFNEDFRKAVEERRPGQGSEPVKRISGPRHGRWGNVAQTGTFRYLSRQQ